MDFSLSEEQQDVQNLARQIPHQYGYAGLAADIDHGPNVRQGALAVVRQDDSPGAVHSLRQALHKGFARQRRCVLLVKPDELLATALDAGLRDRRPVADALKLAVDALRRQDLFERVGGGIFAYDADQLGRDTERRKVNGNVRRTPRPVIGALDVHDGHGRLGRDPACRPEKVLIEHDIADNDEAGIGKIWNC